MVYTSIISVTSITMLMITSMLVKFFVRSEQAVAVENIEWSLSRRSMVLIIVDSISTIEL
jgi:hypothetical protein